MTSIAHIISQIRVSGVYKFGHLSNSCPGITFAKVKRQLSQEECDKVARSLDTSIDDNELSLGEFIIMGLNLESIQCIYPNTRALNLSDTGIDEIFSLKQTLNHQQVRKRRYYKRKWP